MKKNSHSYKYGRRVNPLSISIAVGIATLLFIFPKDYGVETYKVEHKPTVSKITVEDKIKHYFPKHYKEVIAISYAESNMNQNAVGYNCMYNGKSKACKKEDRSKAWSLDCGLLQLNTLAKTCPKEIIDKHLQRAATLSRVQGLGAWVAWKTKAYEKYLATN